MTDALKFGQRMSNVLTAILSTTIHGKILAGEKLVNCELFTKIFLANIHKNVFGICTDCRLFLKFSLPIAFTCIGRQNFHPPNISVYSILHEAVNKQTIP